MARSLQIQHEQGDLTVTDGNDYASINFPCEGTLNEDGEVTPYEINVIVDEMTNNQSFRIDAFNNWFNYRIERSENFTQNSEEYVKIIITVPQNLDTYLRSGELTIYHNAANISIKIEITQEPTKYKLTAEYDDKENGGIFKPFPVDDTIYEIKSVTVTTEGGSKNWYIKDIEQYEAYGDYEDGEGTENIVPDEWRFNDDETLKEGRTPYDGVFNYWTTENQLFVKSFGRIDMSKTHMRYYFRIAHKDVNNLMADGNVDENGELIPFETMQLFVFDGTKGNNGRGYEEGVADDVIVKEREVEEEEEEKEEEPEEKEEEKDETHNYVFSVNNNNDSITESVDSNKTSLSVNVISTRDGETWPYTSKCECDWCEVTDNEIKMSSNDEDNERQCVISYTQNRGDEGSVTINLTIIQYGKEKPKNVEYIIHYYEKGTTTKIYDDEKHSGTIGETLTINYREIKGYEVDNKQKQITLSDSNNEVIFYYSKIEYVLEINPTTITVDHNLHNKEIKITSYKKVNGTTIPINVTSSVSCNFVSVTVSGDKAICEIKENTTKDQRDCTITFTNENGDQVKCNITQTTKDDIILDAFDFIVMNYTWKDDIKELNKDFDCVMFFDTPSIGSPMYHRTASFDAYDKPRTYNSIIKENDKIYAMLAYDQRHSYVDDGVSCIETQVIYLKDMLDDGILQRIIDGGEETLVVQLYGNYYNPEMASKSSDKTVKLTVHTYKGGKMELNDAEWTMKNIGGTENNRGAIKDMKFEIKSMKKSAGNYSNAITFDHMGTLKYNIKTQTTTFSPNKSLLVT